MYIRADNGSHGTKIKGSAGLPCFLETLGRIHLWAYLYTCMLSRVWLFVTPWTVAHQAPLSVEFSRQGKWKPTRVGCHFLPQDIILIQGSNLSLLHLLGRQILYHCSAWGVGKIQFLAVMRLNSLLAVSRSCPYLLEATASPWAWPSTSWSSNSAWNPFLAYILSSLPFWGHTWIIQDKFFVLIFFFYLYFLAVWVACEILVPQPEMEPLSPAGEARSPNYWTARKAPNFSVLRSGTLITFANFL